MTFHNSIIIGELIPLTINYLRNNPLAEERIRYEHIIVDEYQDLNRAEQTLIDILSENKHIFIVGDENQSIYSFRHAHPEGISEYHERHPDTESIPLEECRRCPKRIVKIADHLIRVNHPNTDVSFLNEFQTNQVGEVNILQFNSHIEEATEIARYVEILINNKGYQPEDILILCPRRELGILFRDEIKRRGFNAHNFYHEELLLDKRNQLSFCILNLLINIQDRVSLRYFLGFKSASHLSNQYHIIKRYCELNNLSSYDAFVDIIDNKIDIKGIKNITDRFNELRATITALGEMDSYQIFDTLFPNDEDHTKQIREVIQSELSGFEEKAIDNDKEKILNDIKDIIIGYVTQPETPEDFDYIRIMSLHKSKGLSSKVVIITSCIEGLLPTISHDATPLEIEKEVKENRRLFYVAITRTREILTISSFRNIERSLAFNIGARVVNWSTRTIASRYMNELGPDAPPSVNGENYINDLTHAS